MRDALRFGGFSSASLCGAAAVAALLLSCSGETLRPVVCEAGATKPCYGGPESSAGKGPCRAGTLTCVDGEWSTECRDAVLPAEETCDGIDNDCDGRTDESLLNACGVCGPAPARLGEPCVDSRGCPGYLECSESLTDVACFPAPGCTGDGPDIPGIAPVLFSELSPFSHVTRPDDEWVELYNPRRNAVDVGGWTLWLHEFDGYEPHFERLVTFARGTVLAARSYRLVGSAGYLEPPVPFDDEFAGNISATMGSLWLTSGSSEPTGPDDPKVVDLLGWGDGQWAEGAPFPITRTQRFPHGGSLERKASANSTPESMAGTEARSGNRRDTGDNAADFLLRPAADPQNSSAAPEP